MKKFIIPIVLSVILMAVAKQFNPELNLVGYFLAVLLGVGLGAGINSFLFKERKTDSK